MGSLLAFAGCAELFPSVRWHTPECHAHVAPADCAERLKSETAMLIDAHTPQQCALSPPVARYFPVPPRPVFEPLGVMLPVADGLHPAPPPAELLLEPAPSYEVPVPQERPSDAERAIHRRFKPAAAEVRLMNADAP